MATQLTTAVREGKCLVYHYPDPEDGTAKALVSGFTSPQLYLLIFENPFSTDTVHVTEDNPFPFTTEQLRSLLQSTTKS